MLEKILPRGLVTALVNGKMLALRFGQARSAQRQQCVDAGDTPIPWYTYPAIEYIKQLDLSDRHIFEFGSGASTLFWASRTATVTAVEHDPIWHANVQPPANVRYLLRQDKPAYIAALDRHFDIIIVDGEHRPECAAAALQYLAPDGFLILDNADWFPQVAASLRAADLIEVDFSGFGPINPYTWTTSLFFRRGVRLSPAGVQPAPGIGSIPLR